MPMGEATMTCWSAFSVLRVSTRTYLASPACAKAPSSDAWRTAYTGSIVGAARKVLSALERCSVTPPNMSVITATYKRKILAQNDTLLDTEKYLLRQIE